MAMTRKDYRLVAAGIRSAREAEIRRHNESLKAVDAVAETLAAMFALEHENFDVTTFIKATKETDDG